MPAAQFTPLALPGVVMIRPPRFGDARGYFAETYRKTLYRENGVTDDFVQDNESLSEKAGTIRGLHFQAPPHAQAKLVRVVRGAVYDVALDLRADSPHYGRWCAAELSAAGGEQLYIPAGFAHGFCTLEADTQIAYKVSGYYAPDSEGGLMWDDPALGVDWPDAADAATLSDRDRDWPSWADFESPF